MQDNLDDEWMVKKKTKNSAHQNGIFALQRMEACRIFPSFLIVGCLEVEDHQNSLAH